ncbi:MAG: hypothetical protein N2203_04625 [Bacteroidia bacterium]|nr:hypothetical protein [Bacteroidia bacterium]
MKYLVNSKIFILLIVTFVFFVFSCQNKESEIAGISVEKIHIENFSDDIFSITKNNFHQKDSLFAKKYFPFYQYFISNIVNIGLMDSSKNLLLSFVTDKDIRFVYNESKKIFTENEIKKLENNIYELHQHLKFYFFNKALPKRYLLFISGFNYQIVYPDNSDIIGISTDMYLGSNHKVYEWLQWPRYRVKQLQKEYMIVDIAKAWLFTHYPYGKYNNLLENMMYYGKIIYVLKQVLPNAPDTIIFSYSKKQMDYCKKYEKNLWSYFTEDNRLYDNSPKTISAYLNDGPFTAAISKECPPRIAMYIAYKIVDSYMKNNDNVSIQQLMEESNAQKILQLSKYKP